LKSAFVFKGIRVGDRIQNTDLLRGFLLTSASNGVLLKHARFILLRCGQRGHFPLKRLQNIISIGVGIWVSEGQQSIT